MDNPLTKRNSTRSDAIKLVLEHQVSVATVETANALDETISRKFMTKRTVAQLLVDYASILDELRQREIVRSSNNPLSDYAEMLFCNACGWAREGNSASGHDATDASGIRYQIKARRITSRSRSRQMSAIRNLDKKPFEFLAGLLVDRNFQIIRAAIIPISVIAGNSDHVAHTNSWRFLLRDNIWQANGVIDVSEQLRSAAQQLEAGN